MAVRTKPKQRAQVGLRLPEGLRKKIEKSAKRQGVSMNSEIVNRLEQSLRDELFGGPHTRNLLNTLGAAITAVEHHTGKKWIDDEDTQAQAYLAMYAFLGAFGGPNMPELLRHRMAAEEKWLPFDVARGLLRQFTDNEELINLRTGVRPKGKATLITGEEPHAQEESS